MRSDPGEVSGTKAGYQTALGLLHPRAGIGTGCDQAAYEDDCRAANKEKEEDREKKFHPNIFRRIQQCHYTKSSDLCHDGATATAFNTLKRLKIAGLQEEPEQHSQGGTKTHTGVQAAGKTEAKY